jgi:hypothetical protein
MSSNIAHRVFMGLVVSLVVLGLQASVLAQGRSGGHGGGPPSSAGPPPGMGVDRGLGRSSDASSGRADVGRGNASDRSNGRSDAGLDRARVASENLRSADNDLRGHPGLAHSLHTNANDLRSAYQTALATNPNLKFGQFVAATRLSQNLSRRDPNITRNAILAGLAAGNSIGRTLQDLGLSKGEAKAAIKEADRQDRQGRRD